MRKGVPLFGKAEMFARPLIALRGVALAVLAMLVPGAGWAHEDMPAAPGAAVWAAQCAMCHDVGPGAAHHLGPHLNDLIGRPLAGAGDFDGYSTALRRQGEAGGVWDAETLAAFLRDPYGMVPGTRMGFGGLDEPKELDQLVAWLIEAGAGDGASAEPGFRLPPETLAIEGDREWGAFLSAECATCHRRDGAVDGIPSITGWPEDSFVTVLHAYRAGVRPNPTMQTIARRLSDDEIAALAAYFAGHERAH